MSTIITSPASTAPTIIGMIGFKSSDAQSLAVFVSSKSIWREHGWGRHIGDRTKRKLDMKLATGNSHFLKFSLQQCSNIELLGYSVWCIRWSLAIWDIGLKKPVGYPKQSDIINDFVRLRADVIASQSLMSYVTIPVVQHYMRLPRSRWITSTSGKNSKNWQPVIAGLGLAHGGRTGSWYENTSESRPGT